MKIAVIGSGISGLSAAWALRNHHEVTLLEAGDRLGGHANTIDIDYDGHMLSVDTGFIVYNTLNYPNLTAMFRHLDVATHAADMSFAFAGGAGHEWSSNGLGGLFAWRRNLARPKFLGMLGDIVRFCARARADLGRNRINSETSLGDYVASCRLGTAFSKNYLQPMGAAIWSTPEAKLLDFPAKSFLQFFDNHRLLQMKRPQWRTVTGGSRSYVNKIASDLGDRIQCSTPAIAVTSEPSGVRVETKHDVNYYDAVVFATHADQALATLKDPTTRQRDVLSAIKFGANRAYLHRDATLMPNRRAAWGAWNYLTEHPSAPPCVTYWMNPLQGIPEERPVFVTLNPATPPAVSKTFAVVDYDHPLFDSAALSAQRRMDEIQGENGIWFAGAWLGYGFHEDGIVSGLRVARELGAPIPWAVEFAPIGNATSATPSSCEVAFA